MKQYLPLVFALLFYSCAEESKKSDKVGVDEIFQHYTASSSEGSSNFISRAQFQVGAKSNNMEEEKGGGVTVELTGSSQVTLNGQAMQKDHGVFDGTYYTGSANGSNVTWVWTDNNGKTYTNSARMEPISFGQKPVSLDPGNDLTIHWEGAPVGENEKVRIIFKAKVRDANNKTQSKNIQKETSKRGATSLTFAYIMFDEIAGSNVKVEISRRTHIPVQEGTKEGGFIDLTFDGKDIWTNVSRYNRSF